MNSRSAFTAAAAVIAVAALATVPLFASGYHLALGISLLYFTVLATAWALFSGPTHYISLATAAFFGIGAYTTAVLTDFLPWPLVLVAAAIVGVIVALIVGLSTLRLSGIYFVIFSFGLAELIRFPGAHGDRHQATVGGQIEQFFSVPAPPGGAAAAGRDLNAGAASGESLDVDFESASGV